MRDLSVEGAAMERQSLMLPTWVVGVPAALLLGLLALLGRAGVGIQILGLPLGALLTPLPSVLVLGLVATTRGRALLRSLDRSERRVAIAVAIAIAAGLLRAAAQGTPTLLRFQDMAYLLYLPWIVVGIAAMKTLPSVDERTRVLRWLAWTFALVLTLHWARGVIAPVGRSFEHLVSGLGGLSDKPEQLMKDGDLALVGIALAALALHLSRQGTRVRTGRAPVAIAGLLLGAQSTGLVLGGSRGALLGVLVGGGLLLAGGSERAARGLLAGCAALAFTASMGIALATVSVPMVPVPVTTPVAEPDPAPSITLIERYEIAAGRRAVTATVEQLRIEDGEFIQPSEVSWRVAIWRDVIEEWNSTWRNRLVGIGFGTEIAAMTVPGRQGFDGLNRGVHSILFTILARQGLSGFVVASAAAIFLVLALARTAPAGMALLAATLVIGSFDVLLEGVHVPVLVWTATGLLIAAPPPSERRRRSG